MLCSCTLLHRPASLFPIEKQVRLQYSFARYFRQITRYSH